MNDTDIVNWLEMNLCSIYPNLSDDKCISWLDENLCLRITQGFNLRDAVIRAQRGEFINRKET